MLLPSQNQKITTIANVKRYPLRFKSGKVDVSETKVTLNKSRDSNALEEFVFDFNKDCEDFPKYCDKEVRFSFDSIVLDKDFHPAKDVQWGKSEASDWSILITNQNIKPEFKAFKYLFIHFIFLKVMIFS